jgi:tetratricopeptide (TPR) repeat protein
MESRRLLDSPGLARRRPVVNRAVILCIFLGLPVCLVARNPSAATPVVSLAEQLHAEKRWQELIRLAESSPNLPPEVDYLSGLALARQARWEEARKAFERGRHKAPGDRRFPIELAGVAFEQKKNSRAKKELHRALDLDPQDAYANNFLATLYLLEGNAEAAVKFWNRAGKPEIEDVGAEPEATVDPVLLDRAFAFSPADLLRLEDLRSTEARLDLLDVFRRYRFDLEPTDRGRFNLVFRSWERSGGETRSWRTLLPALRGLPYQTVYPEFINLNRSARNFESLLRWDAQKRRAFAAFAAPLGGEPKWRYRLHVDARKEVWGLRDAFTGSTTPPVDLKMQTFEAGLGIESRPSGRWGWASEILVTDRKFRHEGFDDEWASQFLTDGLSLKYRAGLDYTLLRIPERRYTTRTAVRWQVGKIMRQSFRPYSKLEGAIETRWMPKARGDDCEVAARFRAGKTLGRIPFDEFFQVGIERDNDLWLRGHPGTRNGRKGSAPLGRDYFLANWSLNKTIYTGPVFSFTAGPFLDCGRIYDASENLGSKKWLWDTGVQFGVRVLGSFGFIFIYSKDLRSGGNVFYSTAAR